MKIKILNKNLNNPEAEVIDYSDVKTYEIDEAPVFTDTKNETLDTGTIVISNQEIPIEISPYDIIEIYNDDDTLWKNMCVDTYTETMTCVNPKIYRYEISLFSETKQLEGIILPNLKITRVWGEPTRKIWFYIDRYMYEYCPKIRVREGDYTLNLAKFKYTEENGSRVKAKFNSIDCPEMQWNTPTLREVLNDLMMVADCIPIIKNGVLDYLDLTEVKGNVNENNINYVSKSKSSEDYISELQVKLENVTNKHSEDGDENIVTRSEYFTFKIPDNNATMTTENVILKTHYPIYKLKKVEIMFPCWVKRVTALNPQPVTATCRWIKQDLMNINSINLVPEYKEWITKKIAYNTEAPRNIEEWINYQNWSLYYTRGSTEINNFYSKTKYYWQTNYLLSQLATILGAERAGITFDTALDSGGSVASYLFKIEYETLEGCLFRASKNDNVEHQRIVIDNQTNSMVDSYAQGFLEYQKANRLGNEQLQINARYENDETLMNIGEIYDNEYIVYQVQKQFFKNHVEVNALATKNYILREYFTGVKSKIRSWRIASGDEALTRHDLEKFYCEFSYENHTETDIGNLLGQDNNYSRYFLSPLSDYSSSPLKYCFVRTKPPYWPYQPEELNNIPTYYSIDLMTRLIGNSIVLTFGFLDNYWAGQSLHTINDFSGSIIPDGDKYITTEDIGNSNLDGIYVNPTVGGGLPMYQHSYTDDNGEFGFGEVVFTDGIKVIPSFKITVGDVEMDYYFQDPVDGEAWAVNTGNGWDITDKTKAYLFYSFMKPRVLQGSFKYNAINASLSYNYEKIRVDFNFAKDSQEITNLSTQFEFSTDNNNICFSKKWLERQRAISTNDNYKTYFIRTYDSSLYNFRNPNELPSGTFTDLPVNINILNPSNLNSTIEIRFPSLGNRIRAIASFNLDNRLNGKCAYLMNSDNEILLAFNDIPSENRKLIAPETVGGNYVPYFDLYLNILRTRNKNIYDADNHYLIVGKI